MKTLHILRSIPDAATEKLLGELYDPNHSRVIKLYETNKDWDGVLDTIFASKRIVCWW